MRTLVGRMGELYRVIPIKTSSDRMVIWLLVKLIFKQRKIKRFEKRFPLKFLYCLTDAEIDAFDKLNDDQVSYYIRQQDCLRWRAINLLAHGFLEYR